MTANGWLQFAVYLVVLIALVKPLGAYMARVFEGTSAVNRWGAGSERLLDRVCRIDPAVPMDWKQYAFALLVFNTLGVLAVYAIQRLQAHLPLNPAGMTAVSAESSFALIENTDRRGSAG